MGAIVTQTHLRLVVENLGPVHHADVSLRPFTVLIGRNNTGKTYLAQSLYAVHKAVERSPSSGVLMLTDKDLDALRQLQVRMISTEGSEPHFRVQDLPDDLTNRLTERVHYEFLQHHLSFILSASVWQGYMTKMNLGGSAHYLPAGRSGLLHAWTDVVKLRLQLERDRFGLVRPESDLGGVALDFISSLAEVLGSNTHFNRMGQVIILSRTGWRLMPSLSIDLFVLNPQLQWMWNRFQSIRIGVFPRMSMLQWQAN